MDDARGTRDAKSAKRIRGFRDLDVYRVAFETAMRIYNVSESFPTAEIYSLTDQIRRSSRSVCANISEGWRKRRYEAVFINKLTDAAQEAAETQVWLEFALRCGYINSETFEVLDEKYEHVYAMLANMEKKSDSFCRAGLNCVRRPSSIVHRGTDK